MKHYYLPSKTNSHSCRLFTITLLCISIILLIHTSSYGQWTLKGNALKKRAECPSIAYQGKIYVFGGFGEHPAFETTNEVYTPSTNIWTSIASFPAGKAVTHQGVIVIDDNVWHIGGRAINADGPITSQVLIYNITTDSWTNGPELKNPTTGEPLPIGGGGAALIGRTIHLFGGFAPSICIDQDAYHLTLDVDKWLTNPQQTNWENNRAPLPIPRNHFNTAVVGGKIYAIGGQFSHDCDGTDQVYCHVYDPITDTWTRLTDLPSPRSHSEGSTFATDGNIYLVGGQGTGGAAQNTVLLFNPKANNGLGAWSNLASYKLPNYYYGISAKIINNLFILSHGALKSITNEKIATFTSPITRNTPLEFGFTASCFDKTLAASQKIIVKNLLYTIEGEKQYTLSSNVNWLTITKNATGTAIPSGVDIEATIDATGLAPGNYSGTITTNGTGGGAAFKSSSFCVNLKVEGEATNYTLTVTTSGSGSVTKNPLQPDYAPGTNVTLTANPAEGFEFSGWSGDATGVTNPLTLVMNSNKNITANFIPSEPTPQPLLLFTPTSASVDIPTGQQKNLKVNLNNSDEDPVIVNLTATEGTGTSVPTWLQFNGKTLSPANNVTYNLGETGNELEFTINATSISPGTYTADVTAAATGYTSAELTITLHVGNFEEGLRPYVTTVRPADGETSVSLSQSVSVDIAYPSGKSIDGNTVNTGTVKLYRVNGSQKTEVTNTAVNATAAGDAITLSATLLINTTYEFFISALVKDGNGYSMIPFTSRFTTISSSNENPTDLSGVEFHEQVLVDNSFGTDGFTSLVIGPDNRLYATTSGGKIERWDINPDGTLTNNVRISLFGATRRLLIGFRFAPSATSNNLVAWVSHSSPEFSDAPDWTGTISRINLNNPASPQIVDYVVNLPRSAKDHATNSIDFGPDGALYILQGSNTAMGAPDGAWSSRPERLLTAAVLRLDIGKAEQQTLPINAKTEEGGTYNPYASSAPLTIYATGIRNAYDLVWHSNGQLYVPTNGSAAGGSTPALQTGTVWSNGQVYNGPSIPAMTDVRDTQSDYLFRIQSGGYYGHPNTLRNEYILNGGNPTAGTDPAEVVWTVNGTAYGYPVGTPTEPNYKGWAFDFGLNKSPNGVIEYKNNAFDGKLKGKILVCRFSGGDDIIVLEPGITNLDIIRATEGDVIPGFRRPFSNPLDVIEDTRNGNLYISEYFDGNGDGKPRITLLRTGPAPSTYTLTTSVTGSGTVGKSPDQPSYTSGTNVTLTATPAAGYQFSGWSGDATGTTNPLSLTMNSNKSVTATFTQTTTPPPSSAILLNAGGGQYADSQQRTWSADANFNGGSVATKSFDVAGTTDDALYLSYRFATAAAPFSYNIPLPEPGTYTLKLHFIEPYFGAPGGRTGSAGRRVFHVDVEGQRVLANYDIFAQEGAAKAVVKTFENISVTDGQLTILFTSFRDNALISAIEIVGNGSTPATYTLTTTASGNGTVTKNPDQASYSSGSNVTVTATPAAGYQFAGWSGDATGTTNPLSITINSNKNITATFTQNQTPTYTLTTTSNGNGTVTKNPDLTNYTSGSNVTLTATPTPGYEFTGWSGDATGTSNPITITMNSNKSVTATFTQVQVSTYTLTTSITGSGTVSKSPDQPSYTSGTNVTLTATPAAGYQFSGWSGDATGTTNPLSLTMNSNKSVTATFTQTTTPPPSSVILLNAGGGQYADSQQRTWSADANFNGGSVATKSFDVAGTTDDALYLSYRFATAAAPFSYNIPLPEPGTYTLKLHFIEPYFGAPGGRTGSAGRRVFHVDVEGQRVLANYDIFAQEGAAKAVVKTFENISVTDGQLTILFTSFRDNALISAIEIVNVNNLNITNVTSIKKNESDVIVYPNPSSSSESILIELKNFMITEPVAISIITETGLTVDQLHYTTDEYGKLKFNISLLKGFYLIRVQSSNKLITKKFIVY